MVGTQRIAKTISKIQLSFALCRGPFSKIQLSSALCRGQSLKQFVVFREMLVLLLQCFICNYLTAVLH